MNYNHDTMLPIDAFKKDPLGRIKLHGGGGGGGEKYNPYKDKQYIEQKKFLDTLKADIEKNNKKMTPEEIIAALSPSQRAIINQQSQISDPAFLGSSWGGFNNAPIVNPIITPQSLPQVQGQFGYSPENILTIQQLLANSNFVPSAAPNNTGNIGVK